MSRDRLKLPFKIGSLVFVQHEDGRLLLIRKRRPPNAGLWCCPGGKLEMNIGESPHECAMRELREETGLEAVADDLNLFAIVSERGYEAKTHWQLFLFRCRVKVSGLPKDIDEGEFGLFSREELDGLPMPLVDRELLWPRFFSPERKLGFLKIDCLEGGEIESAWEK